MTTQTAGSVLFDEDRVQRASLSASAGAAETDHTRAVYSAAWLAPMAKYWFFYAGQNLMPWLNVDFSSVRPRFEIRTETSLIESQEITDEMIAVAMVKEDYLVRIPPKRTYRLKARIRRTKRELPRAPEEPGAMWW